MSPFDPGHRPAVITRRQLLAGAAGSSLVLPALASCVRPSLPKAEPIPGTPVIDAHCHVFNASDLPIRGFVHRVALGDEEDQATLPPEDELATLGVLPWLAAVLVQFLAGSAPSARSELAALQGDRLLATALNWRPGDPERRERLSRALERVLTGPGNGFGTDVAPGTATESERMRLLEALLAEAALEPRAAVEDGGVDFDLLASRLLAGSGRFATLFQWANWLTAPRSRIVEEYARLYSGGGAVSLLTPALVDFSHWLEDEPASAFEDQVRVMEAIQARMTGPRMHCFAPFDPWREAADRDAGRSPRALAIARWAVEEMGFIGIKLYPPMGFYPAGNARRMLRVPKRAAAIPRFAAKLDSALAELYAWAEAEGVPIMAHAANSNGAAEGFARRARPRNWASVLTAHPNLRLNLAHFGGFEETSEEELGETWESDVGQLIAGGKGRVFADMSYFSELLPEAVGPEERARLVRLLKHFAERYDPNHEALLYGSDWIMLGRERRHERYLGSFDRFLRDAGLGPDARARVYGRSAVRFLGLCQGEKSRRRLEAWYRGRGLDPAWLAQFDRMAAD